jgi:hypothetical protein
MTSGDLDRLREVGLDDTAIHDAVQVIAYFNYITRIADALGVEPEDFIPPWGREEKECFTVPPGDSWLSFSRLSPRRRRSCYLYRICLV